MNKVMIILLCCITTIGCATYTVKNNLDYFKIKNPEESKKYTALHATSIKTMKETLTRSYSTATIIIRNIKKSFPDLKGLDDYLTRMQASQDKYFEDDLLELEKLKNKIMPGDAMFIFEYEKGDIEETGLLVINKDGEIKLREIHTTTDI